MSTPRKYTFYLEDEHRINDELLRVLSETPNVIIVLVCGVFRTGKSTTLNIIINKRAGSYTINFEQPFIANGGSSSVTKGGNFYGPVKFSDLVAQHELNINCSTDFNLFFVDTEGTQSLNNGMNESMQIILTLLSISTVVIHLTNRTPNTDQIKEIYSSIAWQKHTKNEYERNHINLSLPRAKHIVFSTNIYLKTNSLDDGLQRYRNEAQQVKRSVRNFINSNRRQYNDNANINYVVGSEFVRHRQGNENNLDFQLFIKTISQLVESFSRNIASRNSGFEGDYLAQIIPQIFSQFSNANNGEFSFQNIQRFNENRLEEQLNEYVGSIRVELTENIQQNINECKRIVEEPERASQLLINRINDRINELYMQTVPNYETLVGNYATNLREEIEHRLHYEVNSFRNRILSQTNIDALLSNEVNTLREIRYIEDIPADFIGTTCAQEKWNALNRENNDIMRYMEQSDNDSFNSFEHSFTQRIQRKLESVMPLESNKIFMENCIESCREIIYRYFDEVYENSMSFKKFTKNIITNDEIIETKCGTKIQSYNFNKNQINELHTQLRQIIEERKDFFMQTYEQIKRRNWEIGISVTTGFLLTVTSPAVKKISKYIPPDIFEEMTKLIPKK